MKKLTKFLLICASMVAFTACEKQEEVQLDSDKIYFFYTSTCPHCHEAIEFINDITPNLNLEIFEVKEGQGRQLFLQCVDKFDLPRDMIGTPLICMGDNYIMGWSDEYEDKFKEYVQNFNNK